MPVPPISCHTFGLARVKGDISTILAISSVSACQERCRVYFYCYHTMYISTYRYSVQATISTEPASLHQLALRCEPLSLQSEGRHRRGIVSSQVVVAVTVDYSLDTSGPRDCGKKRKST